MILLGGLSCLCLVLRGGGLVPIGDITGASVPGAKENCCLSDSTLDWEGVNDTASAVVSLIVVLVVPRFTTGSAGSADGVVNGALLVLVVLNLHCVEMYCC